MRTMHRSVSIHQDSTRPAFQPKKCAMQCLSQAALVHMFQGTITKISVKPLPSGMGRKETRPFLALICIWAVRRNLQ
jgi:hypothetical protein